MTELKAYEENGKVYVSTNFICAYKDVNRKTISDWVDRGMPKYKIKGVVSNLFIIEEVDNWSNKNINENKQRNSKSSYDDSLSDEEKEIAEMERLYETYTKGSIEEKRRVLVVLPQNRLDNFKKMEEILEKEYKNRESDKDWVRTEKPSNAMREIINLFVSSLKNAIPVLSKDLEKKSQDENAKILDKEFGSIINNINKTASIEPEKDERLIDIITEVQDRLCDGESIVDILNKLKK